MFQPIPLPKTIADVGPGGPLVTSLGGINALRNAIYEADINKVKRQYAPLTTQAEAASKLAYANFMAPQFMAKLMQNPRFMANLSEEQKNTLKSYVYGSTQGPQGINALNATPSQPQVNLPPANAISGYFKNLFNAFMGKREAPSNAMQYMPGGGRGQYTAPAEAASPPVGSETAVMTETAPAQTNGTEEDNIDHELDQEYIDYMNEHPDAPTPSREYLERRVRARKQGKNPNDVPLIPQAPARSTPKPKTWSEKAGEEEGIIKEGEKMGEIRAKDREELDNQYQQAVQSEVPLKHLNKIITKPAFQNMRKFPWFQRLQLDAKSKIGSEEEQKLVGDFQATALRAVAETVMGFRGRILDKEVTLANDMKVSPNDTMGVILGKLPSIEAFNEMTKQRVRMASKLMRDNHLSKGDALEIADRHVNGEAIRAKIEKELTTEPPITEDDIASTMRARNMTRKQVIDRLKAEGRYNGS